jgi:hypothetical protein
MAGAKKGQKDKKDKKKIDIRSVLEVIKRGPRFCVRPAVRTEKTNLMEFFQKPGLPGMGRGAWGQLIILLIYF